MFKYFDFDQGTYFSTKNWGNMNAPTEFINITIFQITEEYLTCENGVAEYQYLFDRINKEVIT